MARFMSSVFFGVITVALLKCAAAQTVHVVGDNIGWTVPSSGPGAYDTWASGKSFVVGDTLTFNFATNDHDVQQVTKESYDACTSSNPIGNTITTGPANVTLDSAGDKYYICTIGSHCQRGQKLAIKVSATPGASPSPTTNPTPTPPTTPSPSSTTPEACPPTTGPSANSPTGSTTPSTPSGGNPASSSSVASASVLVPMLAVGMGLFF